MYSTVAYVIVECLLKIAFGRLILLGNDAQHSIARRIFAEKLTCFLLLVLVPLTFSLLCRFFGVRVRLLPVLASALLFMLSWPLAAIACLLIEHHSGDELIHALKSGYVIPLLILSLGLPLLRARTA